MVEVTPELRKRILRRHKENKDLLPRQQQNEFLRYMLKGKLTSRGSFNKYLRTEDRNALTRYWSDEQTDGIIKYIRNVMPCSMYETDEKVDAHWTGRD